MNLNLEGRIRKTMACYCQREELSHIFQQQISPLPSATEIGIPSSFGGWDNVLHSDFNSYIGDVTLADEHEELLPPADAHSHDPHSSPPSSLADAVTPFASSPPLPTPFHSSVQTPAQAGSTQPLTATTTTNPTGSQEDHANPPAASCLQPALSSLLASPPPPPSRTMCLFSRTSSSNSNPPPPPRPGTGTDAGAALASNKVALDAAADLLRCPRCGTAPASRLVAAAALLGLAARSADAIAAGGKVEGEGTITPVDDGPREGRERPAAVAVTVTVRIGDFVLDGGAADRVVRWAVLRDLRRAEALVEEGLVVDAADSTNAAAQGRLVALLRRRLRMARDAVTGGSVVIERREGGGDACELERGIY